jgi:hypothetical protein
VPDLQVLCNELKAMATQPETPELREKAESELNSKWTGVQVCAARVLAAWGGRRSVELLKAWVEKWYFDDYKTYYAMQHTSSDILAECIELQDADWALEIYLALYPTVGRWALWAVLHKIPFDAVQERLVQESASDDRIRRLATLWVLIGLWNREAVRKLMEKFLKDPDPEIQRDATSYLRIGYNGNR